ncbi:VOC family protein [Confluentibacter lentus]|uniref:VOC family protein n=1 Tax=Confluentibacter lentus TaxID=1699412 RepID=UPI000C2821F9|nr:VOC family protein [Confluentibacter lentus]
MSAQIQSYLTFKGNCREAMMFYKSCFGGELTLQTIGDSPLSDKMPKKMKDCILHATLINDALILMGTDMVSSQGLIKGNNVSLSLKCMSLEQIEIYFEKLSEGGKVEHPLEHSFWGALFGDLTDKYGNHWLLSYEQ